MYVRMNEMSKFLTAVRPCITKTAQIEQSVYFQGFALNIILSVKREKNNRLKKYLRK